MKVIHYIGQLSFGGIERLVHDLVSKQKERDDIQATIGVGNFKGEFKDQFENLGVTIENFRLKSGYDFNLKKINTISRIFKAHDVVHLHGFHLSVALAAIKSRTKVIYTEHGNFAFGRKIRLSDTLSFILRKWFFKYPKVVICCNSKFTKAYAAKHFYDGKRLKLLYNGAESNATVNSALQSKLQEKYQGYFVIGTSSRLAGFKKVNRLIDVFSKYLKLNSKALLVIVGDGIEREALEAQVLELNIKENVIFEGFQKEVATYQSVFDVSVFPSQNEPFGLVAVECYNRQKPVLVFNDGGGITEIVNRFVPEDVCNDAQVMIERLTFYNKHPFVWQERYHKQLEFFGLERMEKDYYEEYII